MLAALDYPQLKAALLERSEPEAPRLLQALRWRLTKPARRQRRTALAQFAQNDLLEPRLLDALLGADAPPMVREQALRLVNLFASEVGRRSHLLSLPPALAAGLTLTLLALALTLTLARWAAAPTCSRSRTHPNPPGPSPSPHPS